MLDSLTLKDHDRESRIFAQRVVIGSVLLLFLVLVLLARLFYLQVLDHARYTTISDKNRIHTRVLPPVRGLIYDRKGRLIADNVPATSLTIVPERVVDLERTLTRVRQIIPVTDAQVENFRKRLKQQRRPFDPVVLRANLDEVEAASIAVNSFELTGVEIDAQLVRHYPLGHIMAHAVGSVRRINMEDLLRLDKQAYAGTQHIGKVGVERYYERMLLGKVGFQRVESNVRGRIMKVLDETLPVPGQNLVLQVDTDLQVAAIRALAGRRGAVVALEPATGGVLALVSYPAYDPNPFVSGISQQDYLELRDSPDHPLLNRALQGQYEPGSTVKPFVALAGLENRVITPAFAINDPGWFRLPGSSRQYRDWNWTKGGGGGHGHVTLQKAIYRSCNVYFYDLATRIGVDTLTAYLANFGFGRVTSIDLPEAKPGLLPDRAWKRRVRKEPWYPGDTVNIGIGQGNMLVTPLQLATAVATLANRGRFVPPRMLRALGGGAPQAAGESTSIRIFDEKQWRLVLDAMQMVVHRGNLGYGESGTAWSSIGQNIPYQMAGKSGTAQVVGIRQGEEYDERLLAERLRKHAWFIAFAPFEAPRIAVAVLVENGGGGSGVAAPVARQVIDHYLLGSG